MLMLKQENKGDFPAEWGKILGVGYELDGRATCTVNEDRTDWYYAWSIHFEKGTLPVVVGKETDAVSIDQSLFEYDTCSKFNSALYNRYVTPNCWINAIAADGTSLYAWSKSNGSSPLYKILKSTTSSWNWNNGTKSVYTTVFTFEVQDNGKILVVNKNGTFFGRYTVSG